MTGLPPILEHGRRLILVMALILGALAGCSSPAQRYRVLSIFFDGVPNPDAPKQVADLMTSDTADTPVIAAAATILSQHKPYVDKQCDACHRGQSGEIEDFEAAYEACVKCHKKTATQYTFMHGPVARQACKFCHDPHESRQPYLLKDTPIQVCTQCHTGQLLAANPPEHLDHKTSCLQCHAGHGGEARHFLKPPGTLPANVPATFPVISPVPAPAPATDPPKQERTP